ncbi:hypothetical protein [Avibacterium paragallinarum]|nr:hypothetical protein [Avibacterium paragallinarum]
MSNFKDFYKSEINLVIKTRSNLTALTALYVIPFAPNNVARLILHIRGE